MDRTSIFHNEIFKLDNGNLLAKNPTLPNLTRVDLYNPKIDTLTKNMSTDFLLHSIVPMSNTTDFNDRWQTTTVL